MLINSTEGNMIISQSKARETLLYMEKEAFIF